MSNPVADKEQIKLTERMVLTATELGINAVQMIATQTLAQKPGLSLREFMHMLDKYAAHSKQAFTDGKTVVDL